MKLAIVDDNPEELQKLYKTIMDYSRTHNVAIACDCFATSAAFLSACAQISYSFVIFDIYLQDTTGINLVAEFRRIAPLTPIVFLTSSPEHRADAFRVHAIQGRDVFRCRMPFREAASILTQDERFLTINRGILINLDYVQHMENTSCTMCNRCVILRLHHELLHHRRHDLPEDRS